MPRPASAKSKPKVTKDARPKPTSIKGKGKAKAKLPSSSPSPSLSRSLSEESSSSSSAVLKPGAEPSSPEASQTSLGPTTASQKMELVLRDIAKVNAARRTHKRKAVLDGYISAIEEVVKRRAGRWMEEGEVRETEWRRGVVGRLRELVRRKMEVEERICKVLGVWEREVERVVGVVREKVGVGCEGGGDAVGESGEEEEEDGEEEQEE